MTSYMASSPSNVLQCWAKFSNGLVHWSIRMIHVKNYETTSKFVKVMPKILWPLFSGHGVRQKLPFVITVLLISRLSLCDDIDDYYYWYVLRTICVYGLWLCDFFLAVTVCIIYIHIVIIYRYSAFGCKCVQLNSVLYSAYVPCVCTNVSIDSE